MMHYLFIIFFVLLSGVASAGERDDFPTCYKMLGSQAPVQKTVYRELFVLIDQTIVLDENLRLSIHQKVQRFLMPGDRVTLLVFSAYVKDRYTDISLTGQLDFMLSDKDRYDISKKVLRKFDHCMKKQKDFVDRTTAKKLDSAFENASSDIPKTELAGNLSRIGDSLIALSKADEKVVLVVSDMLENSDTVTFYKNNSVVEIRAKKALQKIQDKGLLSDWGESRVYIVGAGQGSSGYRSEVVMASIREFWKGYFAASNAQLVGWGQPALLVDIK